MVFSFLLARFPRRFSMYTKTYFPNIKGICIGVTEIHAVVQSTLKNICWEYIQIHCQQKGHVTYMYHICKLGFLKSIVGICAFIYWILFSVYWDGVCSLGIGLYNPFIEKDHNDIKTNISSVFFLGLFSN